MEVPSLEINPDRLTVAVIIMLFELLPYLMALNVDQVYRQFRVSPRHRLRSSRLFSNPFGVLGRDSCQTTLHGSNATGICSNEMECLLR